MTGLGLGSSGTSVVCLAMVEVRFVFRLGGGGSLFNSSVDRCENGLRPNEERYARASLREGVLRRTDNIKSWRESLNCLSKLRHS